MAEKTIEQLQAEHAKQLEALEKKLAKANESTTKARSQVKDLTEQLQVAEATKGSKLPTVKVDGEAYQFTGPSAMVKRTKMTAEDAAKDAKLCKELVAKGSGWLKSVKIAKSETAKAESNEAE